MTILNNIEIIFKLHNIYTTEVTNFPLNCWFYKLSKNYTVPDVCRKDLDKLQYQPHAKNSWIWKGSLFDPTPCTLKSHLRQ